VLVVVCHPHGQRSKSLKRHVAFVLAQEAQKALVVRGLEVEALNQRFAVEQTRSEPNEFPAQTTALAVAVAASLQTAACAGRGAPSLNTSGYAFGRKREKEIDALFRELRRLQSAHGVVFNRHRDR